jgi:type I restriction enzyme, S subunit
MPGGVEACLGRRMALVRPDRQYVDPRFLLYYYLSPTFQTIIAEHTINGATVNRIGLSTMRSWPVSIPDLDEQRAIADVLGSLDNLVGSRRAEGLTMTAMRDALLPQLMSGKIRVKDAAQMVGDVA